MKVHVGIDRGAYRFDPSNQQIYLYDLGSLTLDQILLVTNVTRNVIVYDFSNPLKGGVLNGNILTLTYSTVGMEPTDRLQIFADVKEEIIQNFPEEQPYDSCQEPLRADEQYIFNPQLTQDINLQEVFGSALLTNNGRLMVEISMASDLVVVRDIHSQPTSTTPNQNQDAIIWLNGHATVTVLYSPMGANFSGAPYAYSTVDGINWSIHWGTPMTAWGPSYYTGAINQIYQFSVTGCRGFKINIGGVSGRVRVILAASYSPLTPKYYAICGSIGSMSLQSTLYQTTILTCDTTPVSYETFSEVSCWNPSYSLYSPGDMVFCEGNYYLCVAAHVPSAIENPTRNATTYWRKEKTPQRTIVTSKADGMDPRNMLHLRTSEDYSDYLRRMEECTSLIGSLQAQSEILYKDYLMNVKQDILQETDGEVGHSISLNPSSQYLFEELQ